jgi:hypothetical protein
MTVLAAAAGLYLGVAGSGLTLASQPKGEAAKSAAARSAQEGRAEGRVTKSVAYPAPQRRYDRVEELAGESTAVVVGVPLFEAGYKRKPTDKMVFTYYQVRVLQVLKGSLQQGQNLSLRASGGRMRASDGSTVETKMPDFWRNPEVGKGYVMFLKGEQGAEGRPAPYTLIGGPQGLFAISPWARSYSETDLRLNPPDFSSGRVVVPQVRAADPLMKGYKDMPVTAFLEAVQSTAGAPAALPAAQSAAQAGGGKESLQ